jgi:hypothetical protein
MELADLETSIIAETIRGCGWYRTVLQRGEARDYYRTSYESASPKGVINYFYDRLIGGLSTPNECPLEAEVGYDESTRLLVIEIALPSWDTLDPVAPRKGPIIGVEWYLHILAELVLSAAFQIFFWDEEHLVSTLVVNGYLEGTHHERSSLVRPDYLISMSVTPDEFAALRLTEEDPLDILSSLGARISKDSIEGLPDRGPL